MEIRKPVFINGEEFTVYLETSVDPSSSSKGVKITPSYETIKATIEHEKNVVFVTFLDVQNDGEKYTKAVKLAVNYYLLSDNFTAYQSLQSWEGTFTNKPKATEKSITNNLILNVTAKVNGQEEIEKFVNELQKKLKNTKVEFKI